MEDYLADALQSTFSAAVAAYLLVRMESRLDGLTVAITRLHSAIEGSCLRCARGGAGEGGGGNDGGE
jgi:hypothetical protein